MLLALVLLSLQVMFAAVGLWWMLAKRLHYAGYEIPSPLNFFMGAVLFFQLPMYFFVCQSAGAAEVFRSAIRGETHLDTKKIQQKWSWLHPTFVVASGSIAGLIGFFSIRPEKVQTRRHQAPVGVRDYVREHQKIEEHDEEPEAEPVGYGRFRQDHDT